MSETWISVERLALLFVICQVRSDEDASTGIRVKFIGDPVTFEPDRLADHKGEIAVMLAQLPEEYRYVVQGWSCLNACFDSQGRQWTTLYQNVEQLYLLGMASGKVQLLSPVESWGPFPGGMQFLATRPY